MNNAQLQVLLATANAARAAAEAARRNAAPISKQQPTWFLPYVTPKKIDARLAGKRDIKKVARRTRKNLFGVSGVWDDLKSQWDSAIADFQAQREQLDQAESDLYAIQPSTVADPADAAEWQRVFSRVNAAKSAMDAVAGAVATAAGWWGNAMNAVGLNGMRGNGLAGALGVAWAALPITLAGIIGMAAAASAAISLSYGFISFMEYKFGRVAQLIDAGVDPTEAVQTATREATQVSGYTTAARIEKIVMWSALGIAAFFVLPKIMDR